MLKTKVDKRLVQECFKKSIHTYSSHAVVQQGISLRLTELLNNFANISYNDTLEIGCGTGFLTKKLADSYPVRNFYVNDIVAEFCGDIEQLLASNKNINFKYIAGDIENITIPKDLDLVISTSTFQWLIDVKGFLRKIKDHLKNDGHFVFSTFGINNFLEIRSIENIGLEYFTFEDFTKMLQEEFDLLYAEEDEVVKYFDNPKEVLRHIKNTGVNALRKGKWTKKDLANFEHKYNELFRGDKGVRLTYHPMYYIAKPK